ncbi:MAG TPA: hypothetical protein VGS27_19260 [Candidatus Sulfotelmatobacter sp.]|nr:hypothetical protein [Candidatus Sulfotelmatobacter sp.]
MLETDFVFAHSYETEGIPELPGTGTFGIPILYFPTPSHRPEHNGTWLKITPSTGNSWIGVFKFLFESPDRFSRVLSTPDPNRVCVVSGSAGYIVKVDEPEIWEEIVIPVLGVQPLSKHKLLIFSDFTGLAAYGRNGLVWKSKQLCWDELRILKVTDTTIEGAGYDPTNSISNESHFAVDIATGRSLLPCPTDITGKPVW